MAMPIGLIGYGFTQVWKERDKILLMHRTRDRLVQWGYTGQDVAVLFGLFDKDGNGELDLTEFRKMIRMMHIGLSNVRILELFNSFDVNQSGAIDDREFVRVLFPNEYHQIYDVESEDGDSSDSLPGDERPKENKPDSAAKVAPLDLSPNAESVVRRVESSRSNGHPHRSSQNGDRKANEDADSTGGTGPVVPVLGPASAKEEQSSKGSRPSSQESSRPVAEVYSAPPPGAPMPGAPIPQPAPVMTSGAAPRAVPGSVLSDPELTEWLAEVPEVQTQVLGTTTTGDNQVTNWLEEVAGSSISVGEMQERNPDIDFT
eukprot:gnl/TRDRNA2_/TRDRNA2_168831_c2_seq7.p1 gnl/TRDRNA2_/TRDRNA2_168831_c2~~gnl/TRDRNA2_/TRDRNA2_168831_c2_seq7.p1  ORF type:complete len:316 (+),score=56.44 gnl/TRDRNA2_/TRDRNA2_168831_c2_seq7:3-950(+)